MEVSHDVHPVLRQALRDSVQGLPHGHENNVNNENRVNDSGDDVGGDGDDDDDDDDDDRPGSSSQP